jgi:hypothetical protein
MAVLSKGLVGGAVDLPHNRRHRAEVPQVVPLVVGRWPHRLAGLNFFAHLCDF